MTPELIEQIHKAIEDRSDWSDRQRAWYAIRTGGIRRAKLPYPGAPDGHYPLSDSLIDKEKPNYIAQLYGGENMVSFVAFQQQDKEITAGVAAWYDWQLKQRSNYELEMFVAVDQMEEQGFSNMKARWDSDCNCLAFDQVDPLYLICPKNTQEYNAKGGADWLVHVLHMSEAEYRANKHFDQDDNLIKSIKGKGTDDQKRQEREEKEGLSCGRDDDEIVLWEVYNRDRKAETITIETVSPLRPDNDNEVRPPFQLAFNKGCFAKDYFPFWKIRREVRGKTWNSSRGIPEINAPFESSLTKSWNMIHQWMDYSGNPTFENTGAYTAPNAKNFQNKPGAILPMGLKPVLPMSPPDFIRGDMEMTRAVAEDRTQIPNLGQAEHLSGNLSNSGNTTATQIKAIVGQSSQGVDMKSRVFRMDLAEGHKIAWSILISMAANKTNQSLFAYLQDGSPAQIDPTHLTENYQIVPNGSADSWNKENLLQSLMGLYQMLMQNPFIDQGELTKLVLETKDPALVKRLFRDPEEKAHDQEQQQMLECIQMTFGYTPHVDQADDDKTHLMIEDQFAQLALKQGRMDPVLAQALQSHGMEHMQALHQKKDPLAAQVEAKLRPTAMILDQFAQAAQANVVPMQTAASGPAVSAQQTPTATTTVGM